MFSVAETGISAGEIRITIAADREAVDSYTISIRVCKAQWNFIQYHIPPLQAFRIANFSDIIPISGISVVSVVIFIDDINDNAPVILNPSTSAISIFEVRLAPFTITYIINFPDLFQTRLAGSILYTVLATDADDGANAEITYNLTSSVRINRLTIESSIIFCPCNIQPIGPFSIGANTGIIRLSNALDFDSAPSYSIEIGAQVKYFTCRIQLAWAVRDIFVQDNGSPPRASTTTLMVTVVDILDPPPTFSQSIYNVQLNEATYSNVRIPTFNLLHQFILLMVYFWLSMSFCLFKQLMPFILVPSLDMNK